MNEKRSTTKDFLQNVFARSVIGLALLLPYESRLKLVSWIMRRIVGPIAGWPKRIRNNIAHVLPETRETEVAEIVEGVCDNVGRTLIEIYSGKEFLRHAQSAPLVGPGVADVERAKAEGKPMIFLTAHIGNYDAARGLLAQTGSPMGALYRPMHNKSFNEHYVKAISTISEPVFPVSSKGVKALIRHLSDGGNIGIVADIAVHASPFLNFFGQRALTPISAAEWALKYDAMLVPIFGLRQKDGVSFEVFVDNPIPADDPEVMMQNYNDSVERMVRDNIKQWFWIHRRWKSGVYTPNVTA